MKKELKIFVRYFALLILIIWGNQNPLFSQVPGNGNIYLNQLGYSPNAVKIALINADAKEFVILENSTNKVVFKGKTSQPQYWEYSGDTVCNADFSSLTKPGNYRISIGNKFPVSYEFTIGKRLYSDIAKASIKALYLNRCSFELTEKYAGKFKRPAGHPDTAVFIHESASSPGRPAGTKISSPGGWYDAGDYNKYIVNSGITTYTMLLFYQLFPEYCKKLDLSIPESSNDLPDVMDEILFNLKWMLTMQDPNDGGIYHKLTNKGFDPFVMPDKAITPRFVVQKTTSAALDFTGVMAIAYRIFSVSDNAELQKLAPICLHAAEKAFAWANANPDIIYQQPKDIYTGTYGDDNIKDEFFWAKVEMALATNNPTLITESDVLAITPSTPSWNNVDMLGILSLSVSRNESLSRQKSAAIKQLVGYTKILNQKYVSSPFKVSIDLFDWGSNSVVANQAMLKIVAYKITEDKTYLPSIQGDVDYILGKNATGYCFVTGFGMKKLMHIHHRPSGADGIDDPIPGFLSGGPNTATFNDCGNKVSRSKFPAKSFTDSECSYSTNEIAINWNAPLFFVMGAMNAF